MDKLKSDNMNQVKKSIIQANKGIKSRRLEIRHQKLIKRKAGSIERESSAEVRPKKVKNQKGPMTSIKTETGK